MQKIKKENSGITLIILVITVIVLSIIVAISIDYGMSTINQVSNSKIESELSFVQESIIQQYTLMKSKKEDNQIASTISSNRTLQSDIDRPKDLIGTRLATVKMLVESGFTEYLIDYKNKDKMTYEQYYYLLTESDLAVLGIEEEARENGLHEYIVNYSTGEVFDIVNKKYYKSENSTSEEPVYLEGSNSAIDEKYYNFTD